MNSSKSIRIAVIGGSGSGTYELETTKYKSKHKYNLDKFGLTTKQVQSDCAPINKTFINSTKIN